MKKELPKIYRNQIDTDITHNKKVYYEKSDKEIVSLPNDSFISVEDKIRKLFKSSRYVFNIKVLIKTEKKDYDTCIVGKVKNSVITKEGDVIPIIEINDIIIKDRV